MPQSQLEIRGFKTVFVTIGVLYMLMASWTLVRGVAFMSEFGISDSLISEPAFEDLFMFFYQFMWIVGLLTLLFGLITRGRKAQLLVASVFCATHLFTTWHDLSTSDSRFGNHLYHGEKTLAFVYIGLTFTLAFGVLALVGSLSARGVRASAVSS